MLGCYLRVSTRQQRHESQRAEIERWLTANGIDLQNVRWYEDKETGKTLDRPAFKALQADIFQGHVWIAWPAGCGKASPSWANGPTVACASSSSASKST